MSEKKMMTMRELAVNSSALEALKETVKMIGVGKWSRIAHHLAEHYDIHIQRSFNLNDFWIKLNSNQEDEGLKMLRDKIGIEVVQHNFDTDKVTYYEKVLVKKYLVYGQFILLKTVRTLIPLFIRQKIRAKDFFQNAQQKFRGTAYREYIKLLDIQSTDPLVNQIQLYALKFKCLAIKLFENEMQKKSSYQRFAFLRQFTFRRECETFLNHLAYISEIIRVQDGTIQKDSDITRYSLLCPGKISEIKATELYKLIMKPRSESDLHMFHIYQQHQRDLVQENNQNDKFIIDPFNTANKISKVKSQLIKKPQKKPVRQQLLPNYHTLLFRKKIEQDLQDQNSEDSLGQEIPLQEINQKIQFPLLQNNSQERQSNLTEFLQKPVESKYEQALRNNKQFRDYANAQLQIQMEKIYKEYSNLHGDPI